MSLSVELIRKMLPSGGDHLTPHLPYIDPALSWGKIVMPLDVAAYFANIGHESLDYLYMHEIADGSAYDQRTDLGNTPELDGDGQWFRGGGPMQITGHDAYLACGVALGLDLVKNPKLIQLPQYASLSAAWFWTQYKPWLQPAAKRGWMLVTQKLVNGGMNGWKDRVERYQRNRFYLDLPPYNPAEEDRSIRAFQRERGLEPDGQVGPKTLRALLV